MKVENSLKRIGSTTEKKNERKRKKIYATRKHSWKQTVIDRSEKMPPSKTNKSQREMLTGRI